MFWARSSVVKRRIRIAEAGVRSSPGPFDSPFAHFVRSGLAHGKPTEGRYFKIVVGEENVPSERSESMGTKYYMPFMYMAKNDKGKLYVGVSQTQAFA